jgi:hypothetical protein
MSASDITHQRFIEMVILAVIPGLKYLADHYAFTLAGSNIFVIFASPNNKALSSLDLGVALKALR